MENSNEERKIKAALRAVSLGPPPSPLPQEGGLVHLADLCKVGKQSQPIAARRESR